MRLVVSRAITNSFLREVLKEFQCLVRPVRYRTNNDTNERSEGHVDFEDEDLENVDDLSKLSRRPKSTCERSREVYDQEAKEKKNGAGRMKRKSERLERVRNEDEDIRQTMADRAMPKDQQKRRKRARYTN
jgi:hypothetical protein